MRGCPIASCGCPIPSSRFACYKHWNMVPPELQRKVNHAYRQYKAATHIGCRETVEAAKLLKEVQDEATKAITTGFATDCRDQSR